MTATLVNSDPQSVEHRLLQLGLETGPLLEAIYQAHLHRIRLTPNHPKIFPGLEMWGWAVAALRQQLRPFGWLGVDENNFPLTVQEERCLAISVASGDEATGNAFAHPSNRSRKGRSTVEAVEANQQGDMFEELLPQTHDEAGGRETWVLLHHTDVIRKEIRIELSKPSDIGKDGKISAWSERLILGSISFDDDLTEILPPSGPEIDIEIRRKAS